MNLRALLAADGLDLDALVSVRAYVRDEADLAAFNRLYREVFPTPYPARTTLIGCLASVKVELDGIARRST